MMTAEHGDLCEGSEASYCLNGGTCYRIPTVSSLTCVCKPGYKGSRCEELQLLSSSSNDDEKGLIAVMVILVLLILIVLAVVIYCACKFRRKKDIHTNRV
ncbi:pro-neuregulin-4, membrane-bound isoform [Amia ocellicauda]|uniref:pro-neuregulin-4, membrane-bound isoform n=1 Tax=Amia ocellicauda TaxID=2972642 RepID=UPI003464BF21